MLADHSLLYRSGRLVVNVAHTFESLYSAANPSPHPLLPYAADDTDAFCAWRDAISNNLITPDGLRLAWWLRSAATLPAADTTQFLCPLCCMPCRGWGLHLQHDCPLALGCALAGFQALAAIIAKSHGVQWVHPSHFVHAEVHWLLVPD